MYHTLFEDCTPTGIQYQLEHVLDYYPFGKILREYVSGNSEKFLTIYHERDRETNLDYRGARYYDSDYGRFLSVDPLAADYAGWSPYNYVLGNPVMLVDPDGRSVYNVIFTENNAAEATKELNASSSLNITRDQSTGKLSATGTATTKADRMLLKAINDEKNHVVLNATTQKIFTDKNGSKSWLTPGGYGEVKRKTYIVW